MIKRNIDLSIVIPCYNEKNTVIKIINKIRKIKNITKQIIIIDDGSNDGTTEIIQKNLRNKVDDIIHHKKNKGKGAAIISSLKLIKGNLVIIQDADLEYDPNDYHKLIEPFKNKDNKIVYGSRVLGRKKFKTKINLFDLKKNIRIFANYILTILSNLFNNQSLTDVHTCYKVFRKDVFLSFKLKEKGFSFCPEITTKASNFKINIKEVPIKYNGREVKDGKKIRLSDAFKAIFTIFRYKFLS